MILTEIMKSSRTISFFLLMAMGLTLLPAPLNAANGVPSSASGDPCETSQADACNDLACTSEPNPDDDNCCEKGCEHCSLPCCAGTVMLPTVVQGLDPILTDDRRLAAIATDLPWVDAIPLYHPPRG